MNSRALLSRSLQFSFQLHLGKPYSTNMKYLTSDERYQLAGKHSTPEGLYEYIKSLPFVGRVESNISSLVAGEWTEIILEYEVGASGLADGAWIKGTFKFYSVSIRECN
jgi:hypothetical protein